MTDFKAETEAPPQKSGAAQTIVLLHGIGHSRANLFLLEKFLRRRGFHTLNITYPSRRLSVKGNAAFLATHHLTPGFWESAGKVNFVTHSMGGLVLDAYLNAARADVPPEKIGRAVMIAPPLGGSDIADLLSPLPLAGVDGTMRRSRGDAVGLAHLKTGSLRDVAGVAGYVHGASGRRYVLVAIANHPQAAAIRPAIEALVEWTARDR